MDCPYCQTPFATFPARKTNCPACGEQVHPKRRLTDPPGVKVLLTTAQAEEVERAWNARTAQSQLESSLGPTGMTADQLAMLCQPGTAAEDIVYVGLQKALADSTISDFHKRASAFHLLGGIAWRKDEPERAVAFHRRGYFYDVRNHESVATKAKMPDLQIALSASPRSCPTCAQAAKARYSFDSFISEQPLPVNACEMLARTFGAGCLAVTTHSDDWE